MWKASGSLSKFCKSLLLNNLWECGHCGQQKDSYIYSNGVSDVLSNFLILIY